MVGEKTIVRAVETAIKDLSVNANTKIVIIDVNGNIISDVPLSNIDNKLTQTLLTESALSYDNSTGTAAVDYTVFTTDVSINFNGLVAIQIIMNQSTTAQVKLTPAGQTTSYTGFVNGGSALNANAWYEFEMDVNNGDALNIVIQVPAGATLSGYLRIFKRER